MRRPGHDISRDRRRRTVVAARTIVTAVAVVATLAALPGCHGPGDERPPAPTDLAAALRFARTGISEDLLCRLAPRDPGEVPGWLADTPYACACEHGIATCRVIDIRSDRRRSLLVAPGTALEATLPATSATSLRFAIAALGKERTQLEVRVRAVDRETQRAVEWKRRLIRYTGWVDANLDLTPLGGRELSLSVQVSAAGPDPAEGAALALAAPRLVQPASTASGAPPSNVIVYLIDTLRSDRTSAYGYARPTTPRLEELARSAVLFENAYSVASWTRPATASLLSSLYPGFHGVHIRNGLPSEIVTLAERFRGAGWSTWAFVSNVQIDGKTLNFEQGFDRFVALRGENGRDLARTADINARLLPYLDAVGDEPFFLYVHTIDPHAPYDPPPGYDGTFADPSYRGAVEPGGTFARKLRQQSLTEADIAHVRDLYDEDVRYQDAMLGVLLDRLAERGLDERTIVVLLSDHGEELYEHGDWEHGARLFEELTRIPLVIRVPGLAWLAGRRVREPVQIIDVMPTLLRWYGLDGAAACQGADLTPLLGDAPAPQRRPIYCEEIRPDKHFDLVSLTSGGWKIIRKRMDDGSIEETLFDTNRDRGERRDLTATRPRHLKDMQRRLEAYPRRLEARFARPAPAPPAPVDASMRQQLEALGYLGGDSPRPAP